MSIDSEWLFAMREHQRQEKELRELNAKLLQDLIEILPAAKKWMGEKHTCIKNAEETISEAEKLK